MKKKPWLQQRKARRCHGQGSNDGQDMALVGAAWSKRKDGDHSHVKAIYLTAIETHKVLSNPSSTNNNLDIHTLQKENEELIKRNEHILIKLKNMQ